MKQNSNGFTIPELLMAMMVIGVLISGISAIFISAQGVQQRTLVLEAATRAGQLQIESLRNNNYSALIPDEDIDFTASLPDILPDDKLGIVKVSEPKPGLRRVDVEITYTNQGKSERIELSSLIGILGITQ